jgi:hypothetical protein
MREQAIRLDPEGLYSDLACHLSMLHEVRDRNDTIGICAANAGFANPMPKIKAKLAAIGKPIFAARCLFFLCGAASFSRTNSNASLHFCSTTSGITMFSSNEFLMFSSNGSMLVASFL